MLCECVEIYAGNPQLVRKQLTSGPHVLANLEIYGKPHVMYACTHFLFNCIRYLYCLGEMINAFMSNAIFLGLLML